MEENKEIDYLNPESDKYYKGYRYEKDDYGIEMWFDENNIMRKFINHHENGKKWTEYYYNEKGQLHNEDGGAEISWFNNSNIKINYQFYYLNNDELSETTFNYFKSLKQENEKLKKQLNNN